jgi:protein SCO1/2
MKGKGSTAKPPHQGRNAELVAAAQTCLVKGEACMRHCIALLSKGDTSLVDCLKTITAMLPICQALERYAIIDARHLPELVKLCITVNAECEAECRRHAEHHDACKACADACAACVAACNKATQRASQAPFLQHNFELTTHDGVTWRSASSVGRPMAFCFGYTHCPSVCPTALQRLSTTLPALGSDTAALQVFFVTLDPERDTAEHLQQYLSNFDSRITGLTGKIDEVDSLARAFGAHVARSAGSGRVPIAHSTSLYLINRAGYLVAELPFDAPEEQQATALRSLV